MGRAPEARQELPRKHITEHFVEDCAKVAVLFEGF